MKRSFFLRLTALIIAWILFSTLTCAAEEQPADGPEVDAEYAVIFNASDNGEILYRKNAGQSVYCGFLSRVMVSLLVAEQVPDLEKTVTVTREVLANTPQRSSANLAADDVISYRDLLTCINVVNSQEAAVTAAMTLSGSLADFVDQMNARAKELGATDTVFTNVTGSYTEGTRQITTLEDCAKILTAALQYDDIVKPTTQRTASITVNGKSRLLYTKNMLVESTSSYYNSAAKGLFIYSESNSNSSIATSVVNDGGRIVSLAVTNQGLASLYADAGKMLTYSKNSYAYFTLLEKGKALKEIKVLYGDGKDFAVLFTADTVRAYLPKIYTEKDVELVYDLPEQLTAPVEKDAVIGTVTVKCAGKEYGTVDLKTRGEIKLDNFELYSDKIKGFFSNVYLWLILGGICVLSGGYILLTYRINQPRKKRAKAKDTGGRIRVDIPEDDD